MDVNELITYLLTPVAQIAIIMAIAEIIKKLGMNSKYIPVIDLALGLIFGLVVYTAEMKYTPIEGILVGLALGLSACGAFSGIKNFIKN